MPESCEVAFFCPENRPKDRPNMLSQSIPHFMVRYILRLKRLSVLSLPTDRQ